MDNYFRNDFIEYFIATFKNYLIPNAQDNIVDIIQNMSLNSNKELFDAIVSYNNKRSAHNN